VTSAVVGGATLEDPVRTMSRAHRAFLDWPSPIPFAHRGDSSSAPENTLPAFAAAIEAGYCYLETDVHLSRDGAVVAFHDDVLDRAGEGSCRIAHLTAAELASLDTGHSFTRDGGRTFPHRGRGIGIPLLSDILESWPDARINIDAKSDAVVAPLADLLRRMAAADRVCVGSFVDARLRHFRVLSAGTVCTSMGQQAVAFARLASASGRIARLGADCIQLPVRRHGIPLVDSLMVRAAHRSGLPVHVWTIDDPVEIERLLDLGVDGIFTHDLGTLREVLTRRGAWTSVRSLRGASTRRPGHPGAVEHRQGISLPDAESEVEAADRPWRPPVGPAQ
jgi:glycerophosphoryl diester phosphodiesterase